MNYLQTNRKMGGPYHGEDQFGFSRSVGTHEAILTLWLRRKAKEESLCKCWLEYTL